MSYYCIDPAEIIQTRYNENENHYEYYVHYEGHNRRLDEWVPRDRIMSSRFDMNEIERHDRNSGTDLLADSSDRKITRNQKRRHDEINHVQKVKNKSILKNSIIISRSFITSFLIWILYLTNCICIIFRLTQKWTLPQLH